MLLEIIKRYKKPLILYFLGIALIIALVSLWNYLHYGTISVTTNDPNNIISISEAPGASKRSQALANKKTASKLSVRVSPGEYIVSVQGKVLAINKTATVAPHKTTRYNLNPPQVSGLEPVASKLGHDIVSDGSTLTYVASNGGVVTRISGNNQVSAINSRTNFQKVSWADASFGVGQDDKGQLYMINNNTVSQLALPEPSSKAGGVSFTVSLDRKTYVSIGSNIYIVDGQGTFKKIYSSQVEAPVLFGSKDGLLMLNPPQQDSSEGNQKQAAGPFAEIIGSDGSGIAKKNINGTFGLWSPSGNRVLIADYFGSGGIYNKNLNLLKTLPNSSVGQAAWVDDNSVIYASGNVVWSYNFSEEQAQVVASLDPENTISSISVDRKALYVYLAASSQNKSGLYRFSLSGKSVPGDILRLSVFLPVALDDCRIDYINFSGTPLILMGASPDKKDLCRSQTEIEMAQDGFSPNSFNYLFDVGSGAD